MKGAGGLLWLILVVGLVFAAQRMAPWERVVDPAAVPDGDAGFAVPGRGAGSAGSAGGAAGSPAAGAECAGCNGAMQIDCPNCMGRGRVERVNQVQCRQCNGSGVYRSRISSGRGSPCTFCRGSGKVERTEMVNCTRCSGTGRIACSVCQGSGQTTAPAPAPSR